MILSQTGIIGLDISDTLSACESVTIRNDYFN